MHMENERLYDVAIVDFETATGKNNSACSIGIVTLKDGRIGHKIYHFIQPPNNEYQSKNISIHGIRPEDTKQSPAFPVIWEKVKHYFYSSCYIAAHNAQFDMSVLKETLEQYHIEYEDLQYFDTISYSTQACSGERIPGSLAARCKRFNVHLEDHHHALSDAVATAELVLACTEEKQKATVFDYLSDYKGIKIRSLKELEADKHFSNGYRGVKQNSFKRTAFQKTDVASINAVEKDYDSEEHEFNEKLFVFTGDFIHSKEELMKRVVSKGGIIRTTVSKKTNYIIEGKQDSSIVGEGGLSTKQKKAIELIDKGVPLIRLQELDLLDRLD